MAFTKQSFYKYDAKVIIKCDYVPLHKFLTAHIFNLKVGNWGTEITSMCHVTFERIKVSAHI